MNLKTTYILMGVLLAVLLVFAVTQLMKVQQPGKDDKEQYVFADFHGKNPVKTSDIDSVRLQKLLPDGSTAETVLFTRGKDGWEMTEPHHLRVDAFQVDNLVSQVSGAARE